MYSFMIMIPNDLFPMMPHASPTSVIILWCPNIELVSNMYHGPSKHAAIPFMKWTMGNVLKTYIQ